MLGQIDVDGKTNEISRFRPLLAELDLTGCVITRTHCIPSAITPSSWSSTRTPTTSSSSRRTSQACTPAQEAALAAGPGPGPPAQPGPRPRRAPHAQSRHGHRRAGLPLRGPGHLRHPPDPPAGQQEVADRHRLRGHQPDRHPGQRQPARRMDPRPLEDREPAALGPRRHLQRGRLPGPHQKRPARHGHPAEPRHRHHENGRSSQHRRHLPAPRPRRRQNTGHPRTHPAMTETDTTPLCRGLECPGR